jgi:hypothetical protein
MQEMMKRLSFLIPSRRTYSFFLTLLSLIILFVLAWFKDVDVVATIPMVLGVYLGTRTADKGVAIMGASKDPNADTVSVINALEHTAMSAVDRAQDK